MVNYFSKNEVKWSLIISQVKTAAFMNKPE